MMRAIIRDIWTGKSVARAYMNAHLSRVSFSGTILDVGGGRDTAYLSFHPDVSRIRTLDVKAGAVIDFESDPLPGPSHAYDTLLMFNVLEHIFNYHQLLRETVRVLKPGGSLHGFVPFLVKYHPDPHDYFRYTKESLTRILNDVGFEDVRVVTIGAGPFVAAAHQILPAFPRILRLPLFSSMWLCDSVLLRLRPHQREFFPLGYYFTAKSARDLSSTH